MSGKLYVVGTPIGNLADFSQRGAETLSACDFIAAEDTRVTLKLLNRFNIKKPLISYHEHNSREREDTIIGRIIGGESCALVTDAGMPARSDPGEELVRRCRELRIPVEAVPGPCAFATALAVSGMPSGRFTFEGFLSVNKPSRREHLLSLENERRTMIFYEAPHKLSSTLKDMAEVFGDREIAIARELTKIHEEVVVTTLKEAARRYEDAAAKGEFVLIIGGAPIRPAPEVTADEAISLAVELSADGALSKSEAAKTAAKRTGIKKGVIYKALTNIDR